MIATSELVTRKSTPLSTSMVESAVRYRRNSASHAKTRPTRVVYGARRERLDPNLWRCDATEVVTVTRQEAEDDLRSFLAKVPLFLGAPDRALDIAASAVRKRVYESGTTVFQEGDKGEALYIIASGLVKLSKVD